MKNLDQLRQESKEIKDKIDDTEEKLRQLKNQKKENIKIKNPLILFSYFQWIFCFLLIYFFFKLIF